MADILATKAPNLPMAPSGYSPQFTEQHSNVLRLYFNQVDNFTQAVGLQVNAVNANTAAAIESEAAARAAADSGIESQITTLGTTVATNDAAQTTALEGETTARTAAIASEATTRAAAIASEATIRAADIQSEAATRAQAIVDEALTRSNTDASLQTQINVISAASSGDFQDLIAAVQEEQTARIDADNAEATVRQALATQVRGSYDGTDINALSTGLLYSERLARSTSDTSIVSSVTALSTTVSNNLSTLNASITTEATARADADSALSSEISVVSAQSTKTRSYRQDAAPTTGAITGDLWFDTDDNNKTYRYNGTAWVATDDTRIVANTAAITTESNARADADTALATSITTLISTVETNDSTQTAAITAESTARADADTALATNITTLGTAVSGNTSAITTEATTRATADTALSTTISTLSTTVSNNTSAITAESTARSTADTALATSISTLETAVGDNTAAIATESTARSNADSALSSQITIVSAQATKTRTYRQTSAPTTGMITGDLWFDSDDNNKTYRYNGTAWVATDDTRISTNEASITTEATARADADSALASSITALTSTVNSNTSSITNEATTRADADTSLATSISTLATTVDLNSSNISIESTTRADADTALATSITALTSTVSSNASAITSEATTRSTADTALATSITSLTSTVVSNTGAITTEATARADADTALATTIASLTTTVNSNTSAITTEATARADADTALAEDITTVQTTVGTNTAAIQTTSESVDGIQAKYTVKIDNNGYVSGYGLISTANDAAPFSEFAVIADKFSIAPVATDPAAVDGSPFFVLTSPSTVNGVSVPAGTYIKQANIYDAAITTAKIGTAQVDTLRVAGNSITVQASVQRNNGGTSSFNMNSSVGGPLLLIVNLRGSQIDGAYMNVFVNGGLVGTVSGESIYAGGTYPDEGYSTGSETSMFLVTVGPGLVTISATTVGNASASYGFIMTGLLTMR